MRYSLWPPPGGPARLTARGAIHVLLAATLAVAAMPAARVSNRSPTSINISGRSASIAALTSRIARAASPDGSGGSATKSSSRDIASPSRRMSSTERPKRGFRCIPPTHNRSSKDGWLARRRRVLRRIP